MTVSPPPPLLTSDTVFFVGNGVLRVAPATAQDGDGKPRLSPTWAEYMEDLWSLVEGSPGGADLLALEDFTRLPAPRQAEWFDREFAVPPDADVAALRLHLLGKVLHRDENTLTNPLLWELARLVTQPVIRDGAPALHADVITTNLDYALEQNIAAALDALWDNGHAATLGRAAVSSIVDFRQSARWERVVGDGGRGFEIRVWKLHGCLRDLRMQLARDTLVASAVAAITGDTESELCGHVPTRRLAANVSEHWKLTHDASGGERPFRGVFSQSEYFRNLLVMARTDDPRPDGDASGTGERGDLLERFRELLRTRPMIFVGYTLPEADVDIVYALQRYRQRDPAIKRWQLVADRARSVSSDERLRQMGIEPWTFPVPSIGFAAVPGKLDAARRHEWRSTPGNPLDVPPDRDWRRALERVAARAWLGPQLRYLRSLAPPDDADAPVDAAPARRLVVAGLGSIWHGFALTRTADFPVPRRVSAQLVSVDTRVPGGSGLVPVLVAAAAAGPQAVGSLTFFSNTPRDWEGWPTIEDLCLSAGVDVHAWRAAVGENGPSVGRTSHIIFFDASRDDVRSQLPRQRFILDVQSLADERRAPEISDWSGIRVPAARIPAEFQRDGDEDFLFTDKEVDPPTLHAWNGPSVYETGASGDELVTRLRTAGVRPTIWTAGVGSFLRTAVALAGRAPGPRQFDGGPPGVLAHIDKDPRLAALADCGALRERYVAKLISFGQPGIWDFSGTEGFSYQDELDYGVWLRDRWARLEPTVWSLLRDGGLDALAPAHKAIGGGLLTTIHEAGLMALWRWADGRTESIVVRVETQSHPSDRAALSIVCTLDADADADAEAGHAAVGPIRIGVHSDHIAISAGGEQERFGRTDPIRRNTLAAGDTVRGVMAYGLWDAAYHNSLVRAGDIGRVFHASAALATLKCYAGSFVDFISLLDRLRGSRTWTAIWAGDAPETAGRR